MTEKVDRYEWQKLFASEHGPPNPLTRLVLFVIAAHLFRGQEKAYPGQERIAQFAGITSRSVSEHASEAERLGWLRIVRIVGVRTEYYPAIPSKLMHSTKASRAPRMVRKARPTPAQNAGVNGHDTPEPRSGVSTNDPRTTFRGKHQ